MGRLNPRQQSRVCGSNFKQAVNRQFKFYGEIKSDKLAPKVLGTTRLVLQCIKERQVQGEKPKVLSLGESDLQQCKAGC